MDDKEKKEAGITSGMRWNEELRLRLLWAEKKKRGRPSKTKEEKQINHNNLPRPEDKEVTKEEYIKEIIRIYRSFTGILVLSNMDYMQMMQWWDEGIPLRVVKMGMNELIRKYYIKRGKEVRVKKLSYFAQAVGAAWEDHREMMIGKG